MAADNSQEIGRLKTGISNMLQKVPPSIGRAGLKETRMYTESVKKAQKVMSNGRSTLASAQEAYAGLARFWN